MCKFYCQIQKIPFESVFFLRNGGVICDNKTTLNEIATNIDREHKEIQILVQNVPKYVFVIFNHLNEEYKEEEELIEMELETVFDKYLSNNKIDKNEVILEYKDIKINPNLTIQKFMTSHNIDLDNWSGQNNKKKQIEIKFNVIDVK